MNRPFFRKKQNRYLIAVIIFALYFAYFLANMKEIGRIGAGVKDLDFVNLEHLTRITIASYINMCVILSVTLFVFTNSIISLTKSSLFITRILPYSKREVLVAKKCFKIGISLLLYEAVLMLVFPLFSRIPIIDLKDQFSLLILFHLIFFTIALMVDASYVLLFKLLEKMKMKATFISTNGLDIFWILLSVLYLYYGKLSIDAFVGNLPITLTNLILLSLIIFSISFFIIVFVSLYYNLDSSDYKKNLFISIPTPLIRLQLAPTFSAIYRHRSFGAALSLVLAFSAMVFVQSGFKAFLETLSTLNVLLVVPAINYADVTSPIRKFYNLYRISIAREVSSLLLAGFILSSISLFVFTYLKTSPLPFLLSLAVYLCAIIMGFLFPTSKGNLNETASTMMTVFLSIVLYLVFKELHVLLSSALLLLLVVMLIIFLTKERRV